MHNDCDAFKKKKKGDDELFKHCVGKIFWDKKELKQIN